MRAALGIGAPALAALVWGTFVAPKAAVKISVPLRLIPEFAVFGAAAAALHASGHPRMALVFALAVGIHRLLMYV